MQTTSLPSPGAPTSAATQQLVLSVLPTAADLTPKELARREHDEDQQRKQRQRDELAEGRAAGAGPDKPVDVIRDAERSLDPSNRAWRRREVQREMREQVMNGRRTFRRALADASAQRRGTQTQTTSRPARQGEPDTDPARTSSPQTKTTGKAAGQRAGETAPAAAQQDSGRRTQAPPASRPEIDARAGLPENHSPAASALREATTMGALRESSTSRTAGLRVGEASAAQAVKSSGATGGKPADSVQTAAAPSRDNALPRRVAAGKTRSADKPQAGNNDANVERILRVIRTRIGQERSTVTMRLEPPELGTLRLRMDLHKQALELRVETQTPLAHRLLLEHVESLREGLEASGIRLERIEVRPPAAPHDPSLSDPSAQPDARHAAHEGTPESDRESAGGGPDSGMESHPNEPRDHDPRGSDPEPATESLVNILA